MKQNARKSARLMMNGLKLNSTLLTRWASRATSLSLWSSSSGVRTMISRLGRGVVPVPARWWLMRLRLPILIRWNLTCYSNGSLTRSGSPCPTSTLTSVWTGVTRLSTMLLSCTAVMRYRRLLLLVPWQRKRWSGMWAGYWAIPTVLLIAFQN